MKKENCLKNQRERGAVYRLNGLFACLFACLLLLSGCSKVTQTDIQFTTGLSEHELFKIGQEVCTSQQAAVLLASQRNSYEAVYGDGIWKIPIGESDFEGVVLDSMKALLAQMKCMVLMAREYGVTLPEAEKRRIREAAVEFCRSADTGELAAAGVTEDDVYQVFYEYRLSNQLIDELTRNVDVEISGFFSAQSTRKEIPYHRKKGRTGLTVWLPLNSGLTAARISASWRKSMMPASRPVFPSGGGRCPRFMRMSCSPWRMARSAILSRRTRAFIW